MRTSISKIVILLLVILPWRLTPAQARPFQSYTSRDGLVSDAVTCILQDSKGFIWVGTNDGLSRYDGATFANYTMKEGLPPAAILCLTEGPRGTLWMGTTYEGVVRYRDGVFQTLRLESAARSNCIRRILIDHCSTWSCQTHAGLFVVLADSVCRLQQTYSQCIPNNADWRSRRSRGVWYCASNLIGGQRSN